MYHNDISTHVNTRSVRGKILSSDVIRYSWGKPAKNFVTGIHNVPRLFGIYMVSCFRVPCFVPYILQT